MGNALIETTCPHGVSRSVRLMQRDSKRQWRTMASVIVPHGMIGRGGSPRGTRPLCQSALTAGSKMCDMLRRHRLSADSPITASRFFNDDHGLVAQGFTFNG